MISPEVLRRFPLFAGLSPTAFRDLALFGEQATYAAGDYIFEEGDDASQLFLIVEGSVDILLNLGDNYEKRTEIETIVAGEVLGWSALVEPHTYKLSAIATSDVTAVALDAVALRAYLAGHCELGYMVLGRVAQIIGDRLHNMRVRMLSLIV